MNGFIMKSGETRERSTKFMYIEEGLVLCNQITYDINISPHPVSTLNRYDINIFILFIILDRNGSIYRLESEILGNYLVLKYHSVAILEFLSIM